MVYVTGKIQMGQRFIIAGSISDGSYILTCPIPKQVVLISLKDGDRWRDLVEVKDVMNITGEEWEQIAGKAFKVIRE